MAKLCQNYASLNCSCLVIKLMCGSFLALKPSIVQYAHYFHRNTFHITRCVCIVLSADSIEMFSVRDTVRCCRKIFFNLKLILDRNGVKSTFFSNCDHSTWCSVLHIISILHELRLILAKNNWCVECPWLACRWKNFFYSKQRRRIKKFQICVKVAVYLWRWELNSIIIAISQLMLAANVFTFLYLFA